MKQTYRSATRFSTFGLAIASLALLSSCEDKHAHVPHDHDGDGIPDHGPGAHKAHVPHDHDGDGIPDHGPGAHHHQDAHDDAKKIAGPNGGRIIATVNPRAEFLVTASNKVRITFLNEQNTAIPVAAQIAEVICGDRSNPTILSFNKAADAQCLESNETLPEGNKFPLILTIKTATDTTPVREKFILDLSNCPTCEYREYACTCGHEHGHAHD